MIDNYTFFIFIISLKVIIKITYNKKLTSELKGKIKDYTNTAIKKLEDMHIKDGRAICKINCNPSTDVYKVVE